MLVCNDHVRYRMACLCGKTFAAHLWRRWWRSKLHFCGLACYALGCEYGKMDPPPLRNINVDRSLHGRGLRGLAR